jgi:ferredoxin
MKVRVDYENCESQGVCVRICPEMFSLDEDDVMHIAEGDVPDEYAEQVRRAVKRCPKQALSIEE